MIDEISPEDEKLLQDLEEYELDRFDTPDC